VADARHLEIALELEERDGRVADAIAVVRGLEADVAELRARGEYVDEIRSAYPFERSRLDEAIAAARREVTAREAEQAEAQAELARAREGEQQQAARRIVQRAADAVGSAQRKLARVEEERAALEREHDGAEAELPRLQARARELGRRLSELPRVARVEADPADLPGLLDWGSRARAALFVAAGGLENERESIVREANELGAAALGELALTGSVAAVRERIERAAGGDAA
jgi:chromosome segregation ATPase